MTYPARTVCAGVSPMTGQACPMRDECTNHRRSAYLVLRTQWRCGPGGFDQFKPKKPAKRRDTTDNNH